MIIKSVCVFSLDINLGDIFLSIYVIMAKTRQKKSNSRQRKRRTYRGGEKKRFVTGNKSSRKSFSKSVGRLREKEFDYTIKFIEKDDITRDLTADIKELQGNFFIMSGRPRLFDPSRKRNLDVEILTKAFEGTKEEQWHYNMKDEDYKSKDEWVYITEDMNELVAEISDDVVNPDKRTDIYHDDIEMRKIRKVLNTPSNIKHTAKIEITKNPMKHDYTIIVREL